MSGRLVLVTGATGFVASHIIEQALAAGYRVRGTVRSAKFQSFQSLKVPGLEFVEVHDISTDDLTDALKGVDVVIHVANPLPVKVSIEETIRVASEGPLNVVRQAEKVGIKKIIITSTFGALMHPSLAPGYTGTTFKDTDWGVTSKEEIHSHTSDSFFCYFGCKNLGERAVWDYASRHPDLDITAILPGYVYGPYAEIMPGPTSPADIGTNAFPYLLMNGIPPPIGPPFVVDVRDVARAHVNAIDLQPSTEIGSKRFIVNAGNLPWNELAEHVKKAHPEVNVPPSEGFPALPGPVSILDGSKAKELLGIGEYIDPKKTMEDTIDALAFTKELGAPFLQGLLHILSGGTPSST